jgi:hypothetical protein
MYETMWQFDTKNFCVKWEIAPDFDIDLSWDDNGEVREKLNSGVYQCFMSRIVVTYKDQEFGADYLGASIYKNPSDFRDHFGIGFFATRKKYLRAVKDHNWLEADRLRSALFLIKKQGFCYGSYFSDMVRAAIAETRETLRDTNPYIRTNA